MSTNPTTTETTVNALNADRVRNPALRQFVVQYENNGPTAEILTADTSGGVIEGVARLSHTQALVWFRQTGVTVRGGMVRAEVRRLVDDGTDTLKVGDRIAGAWLSRRLVGL